MTETIALLLPILFLLVSGVILWRLLVPIAFRMAAILREEILIRTCRQVTRSEIEARVREAIELLIVEGSMLAQLGADARSCGLRIQVLPPPRELPLPIWPGVRLQLVDSTGAGFTIVPKPISIPASMRGLTRLRLRVEASLAAMRPLSKDERLLRDTVLGGARPGNLVAAFRTGGLGRIEATLGSEEISAHRRIVLRRRLAAIKG